MINAECGLSSVVSMHYALCSRKFKISLLHLIKITSQKPEYNTIMYNAIEYIQRRTYNIKACIENRNQKHKNNIMYIHT